MSAASAPAAAAAAPDRTSTRVYRGVAATFCAVGRALGGPVTWSGLEHVPRPTAGGPGLIVAVNHLAHADPFVSGPLLRRYGWSPRYLAKSQLFDVPVLGTVLRATGQVPVHRNTPRGVEALATAQACLREGGCIIVYPEGTLTRDPDLWPMRGRTGVARLALSTGAPVLPVAVWGTQAWFGPRGRHLRAQEPLTGSVGPVVDLSDLAGLPLDRQVLTSATERVMAAITLEVERLRGVPAPAQRHDPRTSNPGTPGPPRTPEDA